MESPCRLELAYLPPLAWHRLVGFLVGRGARGVEAMADCRYIRTVRIGSVKGWISVGVSPGASVLDVEFASSLVPVIDPLAARLRILFDLDADPLTVNTHLGKDPRLAACIRHSPGLRVPGAFDGFELCARAIIGQQVTVRAATTVFGRLAARFGESIATPYPGLTLLAPEATAIAEASVQSLVDLGITRRRAETIRAVASAIVHGDLCLEPGTGRDRAIARLREIPGIGDWTVGYVSMRALRIPDAFPFADIGLCKALGAVTPRTALALAEPWRPWRSYAAQHLWNSLVPEAAQ